MRQSRYGIILFVAVLAFTAFSLQTARAALYWNHGVQSKDISVCFVGDGATQDPDRVDQILEYITEFEYAANIRFDYLGECPAATHPVSSRIDYYEGDIRVLIPACTNVTAQGQVPGAFCPANDGNAGWGSWSNPPDELEYRRSCVYNLKLGDDPWNDTPYLNHTLHEFGHALGLSHEHVRSDADAPCTESGYGGTASTGFMTPYDRDSVMHYKFSSCGIDGNYGYSGLSHWDRLALHILYPEENQLAEFIGTTVIRAGTYLRLESAWYARGANISYVAPNMQWLINGSLVSTSPILNYYFRSPGEYALTFFHNDFLGRTYSNSEVIRVLADADYDRLMAATLAAQSSLAVCPGCLHQWDFEFDDDVDGFDLAVFSQKLQLSQLEASKLSKFAKFFGE